jgi:aromatic ring-opening dioxygenase LigB subunit
VSAYGPRSEKTEEERKELWEALNECSNRSEQSETVVILSALNASVVDIKEVN